MISLYYGASNGSSRKSVKWFSEQKIFINKKRIDYISKKELVHVLSLSNNGFQDILKKSHITTPHIRNMIQKIALMSFNESVDFILNHPEVLRIPIMVDETKLIIGYNSETIRIFIPKNRRNFHFDSFKKRQ